MANESEFDQVAAFSPTAVGVVGTRWCCILRLLSTEILDGPPTMAKDFPIGQVQLQWPLAKALSQLLQDVISKQEAAEGEIFLPKGFRERNSTAPAEDPGL